MKLSPSLWPRLRGKLTKPTVSVRAATERDLPILDREIRSEYGRVHADDLRDQACGRVTFYTAWLRDILVGSGFVMWSGPRRASVYERHPLCPEICRLWVKREYRSRGIGAQIVRACEEEAVSRGFDVIGLGVSFANARAESFYTRIGYQPSDVINYVDEYKLERPGGEVVTVREPTKFLVKLLVSP